MAESPQRTFRVVLGGNSSVGKTSLIMRIIKGQFCPSLPSTLGVDFHMKILQTQGQTVAIQLWDTAGQERFRSMCKSYFRRADGAVLVYDCTCEESFLAVRHWIDTVQESAIKKIPILLCANKIDLRLNSSTTTKRFVTREEGQRLAEIYEVDYIETSAKNGANMDFCIEKLAKDLLACEDSEVQSSSLVLTKNTTERKGRCSSPSSRCSR